MVFFCYSISWPFDLCWQAAKRVATKKSFLSPPNDPTKPLSETATFTSNPWSTTFRDSGVLSNVGHKKKKLTRGEDRHLHQQRDEILSRNYFFTPSPTPLHLRDEKAMRIKLWVSVSHQSTNRSIGVVKVVNQLELRHSQLNKKNF